MRRLRAQVAVAQFGKQQESFERGRSIHPTTSWSALANNLRRLLADMGGAYCPVVQAELFMPAAQLGSPSEIAIPIMLHGSCIKFMHL
jgi:hypothetical protein